MAHASNEAHSLQGDQFVSTTQSTLGTSSAALGDDVVDALREMDGKADADSDVDWESDG